MARRLDASDASFDAEFRKLLFARREEEDDVALTVRGIIADVRARGDAALIELTNRFDRAGITRQTLKLSSAEIEAALLEHPAVAEAGVCGVPHERWGQVPLAFVVLRAGSSAGKEEILAYLATRVARYKVPEDIRFTDQLPRTSSGKLLRRELPWRT